MKISIIGAGNVGSLAAMRLAQLDIGKITLIDVVHGIALGKSLDMGDARYILRSNYGVYGSENINEIAGSDIIVVTAGLARKPGMTREELLLKNSQILKDISTSIKDLAPRAIVVVVTNPLDLMTYLVLKATGFGRKRVLGMGISLDASRFANVIAHELAVSVNDIEPVVIGAHGEAMLPLPRHTKVKGKSLNEIASDEKIKLLVEKTVSRGAEIVAALGTGSAFFAPSAAVAQVVEIIARDEKKKIGVCAYLEGEYGIKDLCIGVPCVLGKGGIENITELDLNKTEEAAFRSSANAIGRLIKSLPLA